MHGNQIGYLALITLAAAIVNGALGYGFSSITVPVALLMVTNRILNPAMVLVEVVVNAYTLAVNRRSVGRIWRRIWPILCGILPGVVLGSYAVFRIAPEWLKLATYGFLLPIILMQAAGLRRPIKSETAIGMPLGFGVGVLYSMTTISGPPLAIMLNNQGYAKGEFRAALGVVRLAESVTTAIAYYFLGIYGTESAHILGWIIPSVLVGIPVGTFLMGRINPEAFRRICMSFDSWIVGFGLSKVVIKLQLAAGLVAYSFLAAAVCIDAVLLLTFFSKRKKECPRTEIRPEPALEPR